MKKTLLTILILISSLIFGQKKMMKEAKKAFEYYETGEKLKAVKIFEKLIIEYPNSKEYGRNLYNIPTIYQELNENELAIKWYIKVLEDKKLKDSERDNSRGIFETNTNFKHYASTNIGVINYNLGNYEEAKKYYQLAESTYQYYNTSGTDIKLNKIKLASNISDCYEKLNLVNYAIVVLLPHALSESPSLENFATSKILMLLKKHDKEIEFKTELEKSFTDIEFKNNSLKLKIYNIFFEIYPYFDEKLTLEYLKSTELYKKLNK